MHFVLNGKENMETRFAAGAVVFFICGLGVAAIAYFFLTGTSVANPFLA